MLQRTNSVCSMLSTSQVPLVPLHVATSLSFNTTTCNIQRAHNAVRIQAWLDALLVCYPGLLCKEATKYHNGSCSCYVCKKDINVGEDYYYKLKLDGTYDTELCQRCAANQLRAQGVNVAELEVSACCKCH